MRNIILFIILLFADRALADASKSSRKSPIVKFSVKYEGGGSLNLFTEVRQPNAGDCNILSSVRNSELSGITWLTSWKDVPLAKTLNKPSKTSAISGTARDLSKNVYNLSGCTSGYSVNSCTAPSICEYTASDCSAKDLTQTPGYKVNLSVLPDIRKKGRWVVTVSAEEAAFSICASGTINNSFFIESPTSAKFLITSAGSKKTSTVPVEINIPNLDCAESVPGLEYACRTGFNFSGKITVVGKVKATPWK